MEKEVNGNVINNVEEQEINKVLFVLFAEFIGYESPFVNWAEDICEGVECEKFKRQLVERDADYIFKKMKEEYTIDEIKRWYEEFYDVLLKEYEDKLKAIEAQTVNA